MTKDEAIEECKRWLAYLKRQEEKSIEIQKLATERRAGKVNDAEKDRRLAAINRDVTVYDGARLAKAVRLLIK